MKKTKNAFMLLMLLFAAVSFTACGGDDDDGGTGGNAGGGAGSNLTYIIGRSWRYTFGTNYLIMYFGTNNSGWEHTYFEGSAYTSYFTYTYNVETSVLNVVYDDGDKTLIKVVSVSAGECVLEMEGEALTFTRDSYTTPPGSGSGGNTGGDTGGTTRYEGKVQGYSYVDLGLSVKWARYNVGASGPLEYGSRFCWGGIVANKVLGDSEYPNSIDISGTNYDAATQLWGSKWRMPTKDELTELIEKCEWTRYKESGVDGYRVKGKTGMSIFLPFCGGGYDLSNPYQGMTGLYWSSEKASYYGTEAYRLGIMSSETVDANVTSVSISNLNYIRPVTVFSE